MIDSNFNYNVDAKLETLYEEGGLLEYVVVKGEERYGDYVELRRIFVEEDFRGKGIGTTLVKRLEKIAKNLPIYVRSSATEESIFGKFMKKMKFNRIPQTDGVVAFEYVKNTNF